MMFEEITDKHKRKAFRLMMYSVLITIGILLMGGVIFDLCGSPFSLKERATGIDTQKYFSQFKTEEAKDEAWRKAQGSFPTWYLLISLGIFLSLFWWGCTVYCDGNIIKGFILMVAYLAIIFTLVVVFNILMKKLEGEK